MMPYKTRLRLIATAAILICNVSQAATRDISLGDLSQTRDRPLFSATRRPPPKVNLEEAAAPAPAPPPIVPPALTLIGVVFSTKERAVIVQDKTSPKPLRIAIGNDIDGWRVDSITPRSFVLKNGDRAISLTFPQK
jgi:hypothetical protein